MKRLKELAGIKAHNRTIKMITYEVDDTHILVEGTLIDDRLNDYYLTTGEKRPSGKIHHMTICLLVETDTFLIEDIEVEMQAVPREECLELQNSLEDVKGLMIAKGFSTKVRSILGGVKGCNHLVTLLIEMAPAAMQGFWSVKTGKKVEPGAQSGKERIKRFKSVLANTCYVWREDGPIYKKLNKRLETED